MFEVIKAKKALSKGQTEKAEKYFKKMLARPSQEGLILYAYQLVREGKASDALKLFEEKTIPLFEKRKREAQLKMNSKNKLSLQRKINSSEIDVYTNYAVALWQSGNLKKAISVTEELFSKYKTTLIYGNLAYFYILSGDKEKALEKSLEGYNFAPDDPTILDNLGYAYYMDNQLGESEKLYQKLMEKKPTFPDAYNNYASVLIALGKKEEAKSVLEKCLECKFSALTLAKKEDVENLYKSL